MKPQETNGVLGIEYAKARETRLSHKYRLLRRTQEVLGAIERFGVMPVRDIVDLGTADGRMLDTLHQKYRDANCIGIEYSSELVRYAKERFPHLKIIQGDIQSIPLADESSDVVIAAAVIEHLDSPSKMMREVRRILREGGILILTSPDPFWERLAAFTGQIEKGKHHSVMDLAALMDLAQGAGFTVMFKNKFMLSPIGMPLERGIETILRAIHFDFMLSNQLLVLKK